MPEIDDDPTDPLLDDEDVLHEEAEDEGQDGGQGREDGEADEGQEDEQEGQDQDVGPSRAQNRVQRLANERREARDRAKAAEAKAAELERRLAAVEAARTAESPVDRAIREQQERDRLALMGPDERIAFEVDRIRRDGQQQFDRLRREMAERADRAEFRALQQTNPLAKKYATDVEALVAREAAKGNLVQRELALTFIIGQKTLERLPAAAQRQKKAAAGRVAANRTTPARGRGDTADARERGGEDSVEALTRRLANVTF